MKGLLAIVKPLSAKLDTLTGNVTRIESDVKTIEQNSTDNNTHLRNQHKELESHVGGLLAQVNNPRPTQASQHEQINKRLELVEKKLQVAQGELEKQEKRITNTETNITVLEGDRSRQGTKLILLDTKVNGLQVCIAVMGIIRMADPLPERRHRYSDKYESSSDARP
jgi:chromosome segregation ATPase